MSQVSRRITEVTDPRAVAKAVDEFDEMGRDAFLEKYGYGRAREYFLEKGGRLYDSKAIMGVSFAYQHKGAPPLRPDEFSGGERTVEAHLKSLGYEVRRLNTRR